MFRPASLFLLATAACTAVLAAPAASPCPQPRFTGKAPEPEYTRVNPVPAGSSLAAAQRLYRGERGQLGCATCHGIKGKGDGEMSSQFDPRPRNFACAQTVNGIPDGQLFWVIRNGSPGTSMPGHPSYSDDQVWGLVHYLRTLAN